MDAVKLATHIAAAVAIAEGYCVRGSRPWKDRNPGDLEAADLGYGTDGLITIFPSHAAGWAFAEAWWLRILQGFSPTYKLTMSIAQIAKIYTAEPTYMQWASIVADLLACTTETTLADLLK